MLAPQTPGPATQITLGAVISLLFFGELCLYLNGCGAAISPGLVECKLNALKVLPRDPKMVTPYDLEDIVNRVNACEAAAADGGVP